MLASETSNVGFTYITKIYFLEFACNIMVEYTSISIGRDIFVFV